MSSTGLATVATIDGSSIVKTGIYYIFLPQSLEELAKVRKQCTWSTCRVVASPLNIRTLRLLRSILF
jgi:hypothetical protein